MVNYHPLVTLFDLMEYKDCSTRVVHHHHPSSPPPISPPPPPHRSEDHTEEETRYLLKGNEDADDEQANLSETEYLRERIRSLETENRDLRHHVRVLLQTVSANHISVSPIVEYTVE